MYSNIEMKLESCNIFLCIKIYGRNAIPFTKVAGKEKDIFSSFHDCYVTTTVYEKVLTQGLVALPVC